MKLLQIDDLRRQLREKFPEAHRDLPTPTRQPAPLPEKPADLTFAAGHLSEIVSPSPSSGAALLISELLATDRPLPLALIDGQNSFDPASYPAQKCRRLLWIRCHDVTQALQSADLLTHDGNLPLILLDLHLVCERELRQIPSSHWARFKIQTRQSGTSLVTLTPRPLIPSPHQRFLLNDSFTLDHLEKIRPKLNLHNEKSAQSPQIQSLAQS